LVPRFRGRRPLGFEPLKLRRKYVSSASTMPPSGGASTGAKKAITLCRQRQAVLWFMSTRAAARRVEWPLRIVSANARHFCGMWVPAMAVRVRSLMVRAQGRHRYRWIPVRSWPQRWTLAL
jgi:hypothetical protein